MRVKVSEYIKLSAEWHTSYQLRHRTNRHDHDPDLFASFLQDINYNNSFSTVSVAVPFPELRARFARSSSPSSSPLRFVASQCKYSKLYRGPGFRAMLSGGAANHSTSFVSGSRSKCFAKWLQHELIAQKKRKRVNALVSAGSFSMLALLPNTAAPPAAVIIDLSSVRCWAPAACGVYAAGCTVVPGMFAGPTPTYNPLLGPDISVGAPGFLERFRPVPPPSIRSPSARSTLSPIPPGPRTRVPFRKGLPKRRGKTIRSSG